MSDKIPKQVCIVDPAEGKAATFVSHGRNYQEGFRSDAPLVKDTFIPQPLLSAMDQLFGTSLSKSERLKPGATGSYSSDVNVYIPKDDKFAPAPGLKLEVHVDGWEGNQAKGVCALTTSEGKATVMPIATDRREPDQKDPSIINSVAPKFSI